MRAHALFGLTLATSLFAACGGESNPPPQNPPPTTSASVAPAASSAAPTTEATPTPPGDQAYTLLTTATGCWLGGLWGDAEGETGAAERRAGNERRCGRAIHLMLGKEDPAKIPALRALDPALTDELLAKVLELAKADRIDAAHTDGLKKLGVAVSIAARESVLAHRAAAKIREDIDKLKTDKEKQSAREKDASKLSADDAAAAGPLKAGAGLEALFKLEVGDYTKDAHAIGVLLALGRVRVSRDIPKHMKVYAVSPAYQTVFGVQPPAVPDTANAPLKPGTWLGFLVDVAKAAGHPVPETAKTPTERESHAWAGMLNGFADKLKADQGLIKSPELGEVVNHAVALLEVRAEKAVEGAGKEAEKKEEKKGEKKEPKKP